MAKRRNAFSFVLLAVLVCIPCAQADNTASKPVRDKWALVVGVGNFADSKVPSLKYAAKDARDFRDFLVNEGNFAPDHVRLLLNEKATQRRVLSELGNKFLARVAKPDDLVVLYFSSHGSPSTADIRGKNFVVAYDSDPEDLFSTGIEMDKILDSINSRVLSERVVLVLDACHSGAIDPGAKGLVRQGNFDAEALAAGSGQMVISSSLPEQQSWESKRYANGVFTRKLLEGLHVNGRKTTLSEAYSFVQKSVPAEVQEDRAARQTPVMRSKWSGNDLAMAITPAAPQMLPDSVRQVLEPDSTLITNTVSAPVKAKTGGSYEKGLALFNRGDFASAVETLKRAVKEADHAGDAHFYLARAYSSLNRRDEAISEFSECRRLAPGTKRAEYCLSMIQFLSRSGAARSNTIAPMALTPAASSASGRAGTTGGAVPLPGATTSSRPSSISEAEISRVKSSLPRLHQAKREKPSYSEVLTWGTSERASFQSDAQNRVEKARLQLRDAEEGLKRAESVSYSLVPNAKAYGESEEAFKERRAQAEEQMRMLTTPYRQALELCSRVCGEEEQILQACSDAAKEVGIPVLTGGSSSCTTSKSGTSTTSSSSSCK